MTTLYGWGAGFGVPMLSPYVAKADIHMQMFDVPFDRAIADLESAKKHKAPYIVDNGAVIEDSTFIRLHFEKKLGVDLDAGLDAAQRATAWAFERMLEDHLSQIMTHERWVESDNFDRGPRMFFSAVPEPMRAQVAEQQQARVRDSLYGQGIGRHSRDERMMLAAKDIGALAALLGDNAFMMADHPTALDGAAFGVLSACTAPIFDSPLKEIVASHDNLVRYLARMEADFFPEDRWPSFLDTAVEAA